MFLVIRIFVANIILPLSYLVHMSKCLITIVSIVTMHFRVLFRGIIARKWGGGDDKQDGPYMLREKHGH